MLRSQFEILYPGVSFGNNVQILGMANVDIGTGSCIGDNAWLNVCQRDKEKRIKIGRCVLVGRGSMISAGGFLEIGDYCLFAPRVFVADADHVYSNIMRPYIDQGATSGRVVVEENCWLGVNVAVSGNVVIGRGSVVGASAVVTRDVPPFSVVVGAPARIIQLFDFEVGGWVKIRDDCHLSGLLEARERHPVPSRSVYAQMLHKTAVTKTVNPLVAGGGVSI
jgi:acetyltransferase-like isoleucine patch superfamily enzyme